jgi:hypothetical protein
LVGKSHIPRCSKADRLPAFGCAGRLRKNISTFEAGMLLKTNESQPKCSFILQFFGGSTRFLQKPGATSPILA